MPFRFLISFISFGFLCIPHFSHALEAKIAAVVNGEIITYYDLEQRADAFLRENNISKDSYNQQAQVKEIYQMALQEMISEEVLLHEARENGIRVNESMIDSELNGRSQAMGISLDTYFEEMEKRFGLDEEMVRSETGRSITISLLINRNVRSKVAVTEEEIMAYYHEHINSFGINHTYHFALIIYPTPEDAHMYATQLMDGEQGSNNFESIAKQLSVGPNPENGGDMGVIEDADIAPNILYELQDMQVNEVSRIIDLGQSKAQVKLYEKAKQNISEALDEETRAGIMEVLLNPRMQTRYDEYIAQLNEKALIDVRYE